MAREIIVEFPTPLTDKEKKTIYGYKGEVVRCKDCRWFENDGYHTNCQIMRFCVEDDDYCSRGERKEE